MAKVAWSVITLPKVKGGLGIVDPVDQCRALLSKLIVRGFLPGTEIWKTLLRDRIAQCAPVVGQPWKKEVRWIFNKERKIHCRRKWEVALLMVFGEHGVRSGKDYFIQGMRVKRNFSDNRLFGILGLLWQMAR